MPPPRCLNHLRASPAEGPDILLDTLTDSPNQFFSLECDCGNHQFSASGKHTLNMLIDQVLLYGPVTVSCNACHHGTLVFDPRLHGYDVELDIFPPTSTETNPPCVFECPACTNTTFGLVARFEYPARLLDDLESGRDPGYPAHVGRAQDLFTWFTLIGLCSACGRNVTIASQECA